MCGSSGLPPCSAAQLFNYLTTDHLMKYPASYFVLGLFGSFFVADKYFPFMNKIVSSVSAFHF